MLRLPIAQFGPSDEMMAIILGGIMLIIPIIWILTRHQQNMAKILRQQQGIDPNSEIAALRAEMARLTQAVHQQTIALDSMARSREELSERRLAGESPPSTLTGR